MPHENASLIRTKRHYKPRELEVESLGCEAQMSKEAIQEKLAKKVNEKVVDKREGPNQGHH